MIIRVVIALCFLASSWQAKAHNPKLSSTLLVEKAEREWVVQIRAALTAFEYLVEDQHGPSAYNTPEEFQELVLDLVEKNLLIETNGNIPATLQDGNVKLGHETSITFKVAGIPETITSLTLKNSSFSSISSNKGGLMVLKKGFDKNQFVLDDENEYQVILAVNNNKFVAATPSPKRPKNAPWALMAIGFVLTGLFIFWKIKRQNLKV